MPVTVQPDFSITHESGAVSQESHTDTTDDLTQPANDNPDPGDISTTKAVEVEHAVQDTSTDIPTEIDNADTEPEPEITVVPEPNMVELTDAQGYMKITRTSKPPVWLKD